MKYNNDKVWEVYESENTTNLRENTRRRVDWIISKCEGKNVLDIGCSQGIVDVSLARQGINVVGIDIDPDSIAYAVNRIKYESDDTRRNVNFICSDFLEYDFGLNKFDTIILTEVMEHLTDVEIVVNKVQRLCKNGTKLVVTVPFGINDYWDHKRTYYYGRLIKDLYPFSIIEYQYMGKWIGVVCVYDENSSKELKQNKILLDEEEAFFIIERDLVDLNEIYSKKLKDTEANYQKIKAMYSTDTENLKKKNIDSINSLIGKFENEKLQLVEKFEREKLQLSEKYINENLQLKNQNIKLLEKVENDVNFLQEKYLAYKELLAISLQLRNSIISLETLNSQLQIENKELTRKINIIKNSKVGMLGIKIYHLFRRFRRR